MTGFSVGCARQSFVYGTSDFELISEDRRIYSSCADDQRLHFGKTDIQSVLLYVLDLFRVDIEHYFLCFLRVRLNRSRLNIAKFDVFFVSTVQIISTYISAYFIVDSFVVR